MTYTLQGLIRRNLNNATAQFDRLGTISTNFTNINTVGFKSSSFDQLLKLDGSIETYTRRDDSNGQIRITNNDFDIAIDGPGFIPVTSETGEVAYSRDGSLKIGKDGYLLTTDGWIVGDGIKIPANYECLRIKQDGTVVMIGGEDKNEEKLGKIPLVRFENTQGLIQGDSNKFYQTEESGEPMLIKEHESICQGSLESSNTDINANINEVLRLNASMLASYKLVKVVDDLYQKSVNLRQ